MQVAIDCVSNRAETNKMELNPKIPKDMSICFTDSVQEPPPIQIVDDIMVFGVGLWLGVWCQNNLKWNEHIEQITRKANRRLYHWRQCKKSHLIIIIIIIITFIVRIFHLHGICSYAHDNLIRRI